MRLCLVIAGTTLVAAVPAHAATLSLSYVRTAPAIVTDRYSSPPTEIYVVRLADAGDERNAVRATGGGRLRDDAAPIATGRGCAVDGQGWATCRATPRRGHAVTYRLEVTTGGGDDDVVLGHIFTTMDIDLGAGDDTALIEAAARVRGGPGDDMVFSSTRVSGEVAGSVEWDGGPGADLAAGDGVLVSYAERSGPVHVTPDGVADDGEAGEGDDVAPDVGAIRGGDGPDELVSSGGTVDGGPGDDVITGRDLEVAPGDGLLGGEGADTLRAGAGADRLYGGPGADRLEGGEGDDELDGDAGPDIVDGGPGDDLVDATPDAAPDEWFGGDGRDSFGDDLDGPVLPVTVTLDGRANDGVLGERDNVDSDFENVAVGRGRIVGTNGPDVLSVELDGSIDGRGGDDELAGGETVRGGPGRDKLIEAGAPGVLHRHGGRVDVLDGERDTVVCGVPLVSLRRDRFDRIDRCSSFAYARRIAQAEGLRRGDTVVVPVRCVGRQTCRGTLTLREFPIAPADAASARFRVAPGAVARLTLRLRRGIPRCRLVRVKITTRSPYGPTGGWRRSSNRFLTDHANC